MVDNTELSHRGAAGSNSEPAAGQTARRPKMRTDFTDYHQVKLHETACLSPACSIVGNVSVGAQSSVFAGACIRGDEAPITIGERVNIQENSVLHVSSGMPLCVGDDVTVGHSVILHGCTVGSNVLVGMGSIIMDGAEIGEFSVVGAGSLVTQGKKFPPRSMIFGSPAKRVRALTDDEVKLHLTQPTAAYVDVVQNMVADGIMVHPAPGATIFPTD